MFVDDVSVLIKAGNGGNGAVSFRHEKYVEKGGPYGGNGGKGGSVIFVGDSGLTTLIDFKYKRKINAKNGENGMTKNMFGRDAEDIYIKVPIGSVVYDKATDTVIADITKHNQEAVICKGGRGGRGNSAFATSRIPAPQFAENGEPGEEKDIRIELRVLAHMAEDEVMCDAFNSGADIHTSTAAEVFGMHPAFVTPVMKESELKDKLSQLKANLITTIRISDY